MSWSDNSNNEDSFLIERALGGTGSFSQIGSVAADVTNYTDGTVSDDTAYDYRVIATNSVGPAAPSNVASATTPPLPQPPAAASGLTASAAGPDQVDLSWNDNSDNEDSVLIERALGGSGAFSQIGTVGADVMNYTDGSVSDDTAYDYRVIATNSVGPAAPSNVASVTTPPPTTVGDIDGDGDVDRNDLILIILALNSPATGPDDPRDLDGDGTITVLDARKAVLLCTRSRCAIE